MSELQKLELINSMEFIDDDSDGENCSSVIVEDNKTNRDILHTIGLSDDDIGKLIDEEGFINVVHIAFKYSNWWNGDYFENKIDEKEFLLNLIDEMFNREYEVLHNRLEMDPGFISVRMKNKNFIIRVEED